MIWILAKWSLEKSTTSATKQDRTWKELMKMTRKRMVRKTITECEWGHAIIKLTIYEFYTCITLISVVLHLINT